jgi:hypothetical protein
MKRIRIIGLCLVAVFAMSAIATSVASAAKPEWASCTKLGTSTGKYKDKACTTLKEKKGVPSATGKYEYQPAVFPKCEKLAASTGKYKDKACTTLKEKKGVPVATGKYEKVSTFTATLPPGKLSNKTLPAVECTAGTGEGTMKASKEAEKVNLKFTGCTSASGAVVCTTAGEPAGTIKTADLNGKLIYVPGKKVGILLAPEAPAVYFASFACPGAGEIRAGGKVIGEVKGDINSTSTTFEMLFKGDGAGAQEFTDEEGGTLGEDALAVEANLGSSTGNKFVPFGPGSEETKASATGPAVAISA